MRAAEAIVEAVEPWHPAYRLVANVAPTVLDYEMSAATWLFMITISLLNLAILVRCVQGRGPLRSGWPGAAFEVTHVLLAVVLVGAALPQQTMFTSTETLPFSTYGAALAAFLMVWPPLSRREVRTVPFGAVALRRAAALAGGIFGAMCVAGILNGYATGAIPLGEVAFQASWTLVGGFVGLAARRMGEMFTTSELQLVQQSYKRFADWLHSDLKGDLVQLHDAAVAGRSSIDLGRELERVVGKVQSERMGLLLQQDWVAVADLLAHHVARFRRTVEYGDLPRVGGWMMPNRTAYLFDRALGDLLSNAARAASSRIDIGLDAGDDAYRLSIKDDGPGFDAHLLEGVGSLGMLRRDLEGEGGTLSKVDLNQGTEMRVTIPIRQD